MKFGNSTEILVRLLIAHSYGKSPLAWQLVKHTKFVLPILSYSQWSPVYLHSCVVHLDPIWGRRGRRGSAMVPFERAMMVSYRLSIVTIVLSLTTQSQFAIECLRRSNQQGWVGHFGRNLGRRSRPM